MRVALVHYAYVPVIGGVELVLEQHAELLARHGHEVRVVCGSGASSVAGVSVSEVPELLPLHPDCLLSQGSLQAAGDCTAFGALRDRLLLRLRAELAGAEVVFVHNVMTMHFNLAATAALAALAQNAAREGMGRFVSWVHDIAAVNPDFDVKARLAAEPWRILARSLPGFKAVAVSAMRQREYCGLTGLEPHRCPVVPNGVEEQRLLRLTAPVRRLAAERQLLRKDVVLLQPARILRRKNVECGARVLAELKREGLRCLYLVTGAPDPHNAQSRAYGAELKELAAELKVQEELVFLSEDFRVSDEDLAGLYSLADLLFLPSRQEGFGLPLLEAALLLLPSFCPRLEPMQSLLQHNVHLFDLEAEPWLIAAQLRRVLAGDPGYQARKEVMARYSWEKVYEEKIEPLLRG